MLYSRQFLSLKKVNMIGYLEVLGAVSIWAFFNGVLVKNIKTSGAGVGMWTGLVGVLLFLGSFMISKSGNPFGELTKPQIVALIQLGIFAALNNACYYTALKKTQVYNAALFHYFAPMLTIVWIYFIPQFRSAIYPIDLVVLVIGFLGVLWIAFPNFKGDHRWMYFATGSAIFYSLEIVFSAYVSGVLSVSPNTSTFFKLLFQAMVMPVVGLAMREQLKVENRGEVKKLIFGGVLLYLSFILFFSGASQVRQLHLGLLSYIDRIGAIFLAAIFFKEKITRNALVGGICILGASLLVLFLR